MGGSALLHLILRLWIPGRLTSHVARVPPHRQCVRHDVHGEQQGREELDKDQVTVTFL